MVKKTKNNREINRLKEAHELSITNPIPPPYSNSVSNFKNFEDDLIGSLSEAYENRRARQVFEWEMGQKRTHHSAV